MKRVLIIADAHIEEKTPAPYKILKRFIKKEYGNIDQVVLLGDYADVISLNQWDKDKRQLMEGRRYKKEMDNVNNELDFLQEYFKDITYIEGNHESVDFNTEILTKKGWVIASDLDYNNEIASFNGNEISFENPIKITKGKTAPLWSVKGNLTEELVSEAHRIYVDNKLTNIKEFDTIQANRMRYSGYYPNKTILDITPKEMRFIAWIMCDGCVVNRNNKVHHLQFKLSRQDKIDKLKELLEKLDIDYTFQKATMSGCNQLQPYMIRIYSDNAKKYASYLDENKSLKEEYKFLDKEYLQSLITGITETDGSITGNQVRWVTVNKKNAEIFQMMCVFNNIDCRINEVENASGFKNGKLQYQVIFRESSLSRGKNMVKDTGLIGEIVSIQSVNDTLITRRNGKIAFTGNSRASRYIEKNPELEGIIEVKNMLHLEKRGIKWIPDNIYEKTNDFFKLGKMHFHHGLSCGQGAAKSMAIKLGCNIMFGHLHKQLIHMEVPAKNEAHICYIIGCLCDKQPKFRKGNPSGWVNQFAIMDYNEDVFDVNIITMINNKFIFNSKVYK